MVGWIHGNANLDITHTKRSKGGQQNLGEMEMGIPYGKIGYMLLRRFSFSCLHLQLQLQLQLQSTILGVFCFLLFAMLFACCLFSPHGQLRPFSFFVFPPSLHAACFLLVCILRLRSSRAFCMPRGWFFCTTIIPIFFVILLSFASTFELLMLYDKKKLHLLLAQIYRFPLAAAVWSSIIFRVQSG